MRIRGTGMVGALALFIPLASVSAEPPPGPGDPPPPRPKGGLIKRGEAAPMFKSVDEKMRPVDMRDETRERPLVLIVGSVT